MRSRCPVRWGLPFLISAFFTLSCGSGSDGGSSPGGVVGFVTGTEAPGAVPSDGGSPNGPTITSVSATPSQIKQGEPLIISLSYGDPQGDLAKINFGITGEEKHYEMAATGSAGATSGTFTLSLKPKTYVPGIYTLALSLVDSAGNVSQAATAAFTILNSNGTPPDSRDGGLATIDSASASGHDARAVDAGLGPAIDGPGGKAPTNNLLINGSFEAYVVTAADTVQGLPWTVRSSSSVPGWTQFLDGVDLIQNNYQQAVDCCAVLVQASDGVQFVDMNQAGALGGIYQTVSATAGTAYTLQLDTAAWAKNAIGGTIRYDLYDPPSNTVLASGSYTDAVGGTWTTRSLSAIAISSQIGVRIQGTAATQAGMGLDNVILARVEERKVDGGTVDAGASSDGSGLGTPANLLVNGSFEAYVVTAADTVQGLSWTVRSATSVPGWTQFLDGVDLIQNNYQQSTDCCAVLVHASDGVQFIDLNQAGALGGIYQEVAAAAGVSYTLRLDIVAWAKNAIGGTVLYELYDPTTKTVLASASYTDKVGGTWATRTLSAVANSAQIGVRIQGTAATQAGMGLDNVILTR